MLLPDAVMKTAHLSKEGHGLMAATAFESLTGKKAPATAPSK